MQPQDEVCVKVYNSKKHVNVFKYIVAVQETQRRVDDLVMELKAFKRKVLAGWQLRKCLSSEVLGIIRDCRAHLQRVDVVMKRYMNNEVFGFDLSSRIRVTGRHRNRVAKVKTRVGRNSMLSLKG